MAVFLLSKVATAVALMLLASLTSLPPNTLSETKGDKGKDKLFKPGSVTAARVCSVIWAIAALTALLDDRYGYQSMRQPWSAPDVIYAVIGLLGSLLRLWAMRTLSNFFTFEVGIVKDHRLVQTGPYRLIRHPSYTGGLLAFIGGYAFLGLHPTTLPFWLILGGPIAAFMVLRIRNEEETLHQHFGKEWEKHCKRTWRLLPPLY